MDALIPGWPSPSDSHLFLLIDRANTELPWLYQKMQAPEPEFLFWGTDYSDIQLKGPALINISNEQAFYPELVARLSNKDAPLCGVLISADMPDSAVANWCRARLFAQFYGSKRGLLRFYDPRVAHYLLNAEVAERLSLKDPNASDWLYGIDMMAYFGGGYEAKAGDKQQWHFVTHNAETSAPETGRLSDAQESRLHLMLVEQFVFKVWQGQQTRDFAQLLARFRRAEALGLVSDEALEAYMLLAPDEATAAQMDKALGLAEDEAQRISILADKQEVA